MDVIESDNLYNLVYLQGYGAGTFRAGVTPPTAQQLQRRS